MIKEISAFETFLVRHPVLRADKNIETCVFDGDDLETTKHFGYFINEKLIGVASIYQNRNLNFLELNQLQLRGMAILKNHQKNGFGEKLLNYCEYYANKNQIELIWFNARKIAIPFYEKLGYSIFGSFFETPEIGNHIVMFKRFVY